MKKKIILAFLVLPVLMNATILQAGIIYPLLVFTNNGGHFDDPNLNLYVVVTPMGATIDFEFHNDSFIDSSIARIYFDDNSLLSVAGISEGPGTLFNIPATPSRLPAGQELVPSFETDFGACSDAARPHNGINPTEWVIIHCNLIGGATPENVTGALNNADLRIGVHIISLPDGSSEAAVIPEPATLLLLGLGAVILKRKF